MSVSQPRETLPVRSLLAADLRFTLVTCVLLVIAHAVAYLMHEYSHSFMAWSLGWMAHPLALDYGRPTLSNLLFLSDVSDNVNYHPILASGHGVSAAIIALAGTYVGNAPLYVLLYPLAKTNAISSRRLALSFVYWLSLMCAGNVWSYVPIRALTTHADIAIAANGLHLPSWGLFPVLIAPTLYIAWHFFRRMSPRCYAGMAAGSSNVQVLLIVLTSFCYFAFFGAAGLNGSYGRSATFLSLASCYLLFPLCVVYLASLYLPLSPRDDRKQSRPPKR